MEYDEILKEYAEDILHSETFISEKKYQHHKYTSTYQHSIHVAKIALRFIEKHHIANVSIPDLVRGALLHDYYLYNWHNREEKWHKPHAYKHPKIAAQNALRDFQVNENVYNSILTHMWPLTLRIPKSKEAWIITYADKVATYRERFKKETS